MKLYKALKLRKKLAGEINTLQLAIRARNSYVMGSANSIKYNVLNLESELMAKTERLINLKMAINKANLGIMEAIYRLAECKSLAAMWSMTDVTEGRSLTNAYRAEPIIVEHKVYVDELSRDQRVKELQEKIEALQEQIDVYNYVTDIDFEG